MAKKITCATLLISVFLPLPSSTAQSQTTNFVQRTNTNLTLDGKPFRYSGPNIEWLGLEGYGPHDPYGPRYPSHFEIDDAFETAAEMGAKVARAQTMGDTVGCPLCIEPTSGNFQSGSLPGIRLRSRQRQTARHPTHHPADRRLRHLHPRRRRPVPRLEQKAKPAGFFHRPNAHHRLREAY